MIRTIMKIFVAAALCAPTAVEAGKGKGKGGKGGKQPSKGNGKGKGKGGKGGKKGTSIVSWNAQGNDSNVPGHIGDFKSFFKSQEVSKSKIIMVQESGDGKKNNDAWRKNNGEAKNFGWGVKIMRGGLTTLWDTKEYKMVNNSMKCDKLPGGDTAQAKKDGVKANQRNGWVCTVLLKGKQGHAMVTNVHAGHNGSKNALQIPSSMKTKQVLVDHQKTYMSKHPEANTGIRIVGGDFNEMGLALNKVNKSPMAGNHKGMGKWGDTHSNGKMDLMFASKSALTSSRLSKFKSDHHAVRIVV